MIIKLHLELTDQREDCPFCGSADLELHNTHTAYYCVECNECGAQVSGKPFGTRLPSNKLTMANHRRAKASALAAWNRRAPTHADKW